MVSLIQLYMNRSAKFFLINTTLKIDFFSHNETGKFPLPKLPQHLSNFHAVFLVRTINGSHFCEVF